MFIAAAAISVPAAPQQPTPPARGLEQTIALALEVYPSIAGSEARQVAADSEMSVARAEYLPKVDVLLQANRSTINNVTGLLLPQGGISSISGPPFPETSKSAWNSAAGVLASWQPFDFGYRGRRVNAARERASAAAQDTALTRLDVEASAATAYLNLAAAQRLHAVAGANLDRLKKYRFAVDVLVANKLRAGVEGQLAAAAEAQAEAVQAQARREVDRNRATLARLTGEAWGTELLQVPDVAPSLGAMEQAGPHPAVQRQQALARAADQEASATAHSYAPTVALVGSAFARGAGRAANGTFGTGSAGLVPDTGNWAAGVQVSFPLGSLPAVRAKTAALRGAAAAEWARYQETLAVMAERRSQADAALISAQEIARVAPIQLEAAQLAYEQQQARYRSGLVTAVEVSAAAAVLAQAEAQAAIARIDLVRALVEQSAANGSMAGFHATLRAN